MKFLYSKYSRHRLPQYQIETSIWMDGQKKFVVKKALTESAKTHIYNICMNNTLVKEYNGRHGNFLNIPTIVKQTERSISFEYIEGKSFSDQIFDLYVRKDTEAIKRLLQSYMSLLERFAVKDTDLHDPLLPMLKTANAKKLSRITPSMSIGLFDMIFDNLIVKKGQLYLIDSEWNFGAPIPIRFTLFRAVSIFYHTYKDFGLERLYPFHQLCSDFDISIDMQQFFIDMEMEIQKFITGNYFHPVVLFLKPEKTIDGIEKQLHTLDEQLSAKTTEARALDEQLSAKTTEARALDEQLSAKTTEVRAMRDSYSWRLSRPLRFTGRMWLRLRK